VPLEQIASGKGLPSNRGIPLVVVCASGVRSGKAVAELQKMGYEKAQSLSGGLKAWRDANLPVDKS
jgi:rhodanese-related sulfurtransferase